MDHPLPDQDAIQQALNKAARQAMRQARVHEGLVPVWRDGAVTWVPPESIEAALDQAGAAPAPADLAEPATPAEPEAPRPGRGSSPSP